MNIIKAARTSLDMSQPEFSIWLADKVGRNAPFPISRISEWENGKRSPRKNIRDICLPIVAGAIASDACALFNDATNSVVMQEVKTVIKERVIVETS